MDKAELEQWLSTARAALSDKCGRYVENMRRQMPTMLEQRLLAELKFEIAWIERLHQQIDELEKHHA